MNFATHTSAMVFYRKEHGLSQTEVARAMATTQSAVARLEKRLLTGADVTLSALQRYAEAIGLSIELTLKPVKQRYGFFPQLKLQLRPLSIHRHAKAERFLLMKSKICGKWFVAKFPDKI